MRDRKRKRRDYKVEEPPPGPVVLANLSERAKMTFPQKIYGVPYEFLPPWYHPSVLSSVEEMVFDGVFDEEGGIFTRERYIFLRDEIIYRLYENRKYGLSLMECYKDLGDPGEFIRVCLFLRHWNIIFPESETYFPRIGRRKNGCLGLLSLPEELIHFQPQPPLSEELTPFELDLCTICGQNSDALQFHCLKNAREILCGSCYCQGHYDTWFSSSDFEPFLPLPDTWSTPEIETLHQSVEDHGEDWAEVSKRVATRSMDECVLKFLRLPEEVYDYRFDPQASIAGGLVEAARALAAGLCESVAIAGAKAALDIFKEHVDISIRGVISSGDVFAELNWIERAVENEICHCLPEKRNALFSFKSDAHFAFLRASTEKAKVSPKASLYLSRNDFTIVIFRKKPLSVPMKLKRQSFTSRAWNMRK